LHTLPGGSIVAARDHSNPQKDNVHMPNQIVVENQNPGTSDWRIGEPALDGEIEGFVSTTSALPEETIELFISTKAKSYSMQVFRLGWYGGSRARLMLEETSLVGMDQSAATALDPDFDTVHCTRWKASYQLRIPKDWVTGAYLVKLATRARPSLGRYMIFMLKPLQPSDLILVSTVATNHAYNGWQGDFQGRGSLYDNFTTGPNSGTHVNAVSFNRPYADALGTGKFLFWEHPMLVWLEQQGYDVSYASSEDLHQQKIDLQNYRALLSVGHDEYWSFEMREALESAISNGLSVGFFGANPIYWQVRFQPANRNMVCYKHIPHLVCPYDAAGTKTGPAVDPASGLILCVDPPPVGVDPWAGSSVAYERSRITARWRDLVLGRPEQNVVGQMYQDYLRDSNAALPWTVSDDTHWIFTGTGLRNGDAIDGMIGGEFDRVFPDPAQDNATSDLIPVSTPATLKVIGTSDIDNGGVAQVANSTIYEASSGARVFSAGTFTWSWGLADMEGLPTLSSPVPYSLVDSRIQRITANILNNFVTGVLPGRARIGVLSNQGTLFVKEGPLDALWWAESLGTANFLVRQFVLGSDRIGVVDQSGNLLVREGIFGTDFVWQTFEVKSFVLSGRRIAALLEDGNVYVKEGALDAAWTWESSNVQSLVLSGNRIGVLHQDGNVYVKEGALDAAWTWESGSVQNLVLSGNRIGVLHRDGNAYVKEGALDAAWMWESSKVQSLVLSGNRIGVLHRDGNVYVKEGALDAAWTWESGSVQNLVLSGNRIGVLHQDANVYVKEGALDAAWTWESSEIQALVLSGNRIGVLHRDGNVYVKEGALDAAWTWESSNVSILALSPP
jgi:hypothetical protein